MTASRYKPLINYPRVTVWDDPRFGFQTQFQQLPFGYLMQYVHVAVTDGFTWNKSVLKAMKNAWNTVRPNLDLIVYGIGEVSDDKWRKFARHFDMKHLIDVPCVDGEVRSIHFHTRNQRHVDGLFFDNHIRQLHAAVGRPAAVPGRRLLHGAGQLPGADEQSVHRSCGGGFYPATA